MKRPPKKVAIAFPLADGPRHLLQRIAETAIAEIPENAVNLPCCVCGIHLAVGPRVVLALQADDELTLMCIICLIDSGAGSASIHMINLSHLASVPVM